MRLNVLLILAFIVMFFGGCKKDPFLPNVAKCVEFKLETKKGVATTGELPQKHYPFRSNPFFNPANNDQFLYIEQTKLGESLVFATISTKTKKTLIKNSYFIGQPRINTQKKIVFVDHSGSLNIYNLINDSIRIITKNGFYDYPFWDTDSTLICRYSAKVGVPYYKLRISINGNVIDSAKNTPFINAVINSNGFVATKSFSVDKILLYNPENILISELAGEANGESKFGSLSWYSNNELLYTDIGEGVMKMNVTTRRVVNLIDGCYQNSYANAYPSADKSKIIVDRIDLSIEYSPYRKVYQDSNIFLFDVVTKKITKFDFL